MSKGKREARNGETETSKGKGEARNGETETNKGKGREGETGSRETRKIGG